MTSDRSLLTVAIDTTSEIAGIALLEGDALLGEITWRSRQNHSRELLPTLEWLLQRSQRPKTDLGAVVVCLGPGSYAGMRVGVSTANALAYGLSVPIAGVGRLAADAYPFAAATPGRVIAVHAAGRADLAWGVYEALSPLTLTLSQGERGSELLNLELREIEAPCLGPAADLLTRVQPGDIVCGEIEKLREELRAALVERGARLCQAHESRVLAVARLGLQRLARGDIDNADTLVPMYLRAPAIGPQQSP